MLDLTSRRKVKADRGRRPRKPPERVCVMDEAGKVIARGKAPSDPKALFEVLREHCLCPERIVLETGTLSFWLARELGKRGLPVAVIDARPARTR